MNLLEKVNGFSDENPQDILEQYILAIANQDAEKLVEFYGGSYEGFINLSPETDPNDKQKLFEQYLKLIPKISLNEMLDQSEGSKDEYQFVITFKQEDGTLFQTRELDTITNEFTYTVTRVDGKLKVMEHPPYQRLVYAQSEATICGCFFISPFFQSLIGLYQRSLLKDPYFLQSGHYLH